MAVPLNDGSYWKWGTPMSMDSFLRAAEVIGVEPWKLLK